MKNKMNTISDALSHPELNAIATVSLTDELQNQIKQYYENDEYCKSMMKQIQKDDSESSNYFIEDGMFYQEPENILIIPRECQLNEKMLYEFHDCKLSAHQRIGKTLNNIKKVYC